MTTVFKHAVLGEVEGNAISGVVQFLGLKYGSLRNRFASAELVTGYGAGRIDATKFGAPPISPAGAIEREFGFIQQSLPLPQVPAQSDIEGLSLNITVPTTDDGTIDANANLPVHIFIHGGGFMQGSSWYPHYNQAPIVRKSKELGKPIISITINYRLGVAGFLTSEELRKAGYKANNGFHDQRLALKWVKTFIGGFGGNKDEITVSGESAGGMSATMLLTSPEPMMKRCLSTGGAVLLFKPIPLFVADAAYQRVIEAFGLADKSPEARIEALLKVPTDDLWQKIPPGTPLVPTTDGETVIGNPNFLSVSAQEDDPTFLIPGRKWCAALMIGESKLDANILAWLGLDNQNPGIAAKFVTSVSKTLASHPNVAEQLLSSYNVTDSTPDNEAMLQILRFATESSFYAPARAFGQGWPQTGSKYFLYHFNEGNPWDGRFKGEAGHILDVAFLFQNYNKVLDTNQQKLAGQYAEDFIKFVNGEDPWPPVKGGNLGARVYGPTNEGIMTKYVGSGEPREVGRDDRVLKLGNAVGFDIILEVFQNFMQGR